jgi:hypothetical protein
MFEYNNSHLAASRRFQTQKNLSLANAYSAKACPLF